MRGAEHTWREGEEGSVHAGPMASVVGSLYNTEGVSVEVTKVGGMSWTLREESHIQWHGIRHGIMPTSTGRSIC
jgi:hypothetical protein